MGCIALLWKNYSGSVVSFCPWTFHYFFRALKVQFLHNISKLCAHPFLSHGKPKILAQRPSTCKLLLFPFSQFNEVNGRVWGCVGGQSDGLPTRRGPRHRGSREFSPACRCPPIQLCTSLKAHRSPQHFHCQHGSERPPRQLRQRRSDGPPIRTVPVLGLMCLL